MFTKYRFWFPLLLLLIAVFLVRGTVVLTYQNYKFAPGPDYGQLFLYTETFIRTGNLPATVPYFQLGQTHWSVLPGAGLLLASFTTFTGLPLEVSNPIILFLGLIEVLGTYYLAWDVFRRLDAALIAAGIVTFLPLITDMMSWANYANIIALALMPIVFLSWMRYWNSPSWRNLLLASVILCTACTFHHLSTVWLGLTLALFVLAHLLLIPRQTLQKSLLIGTVCLVIAFPLLLDIVNIGHLLSSNSYSTLLSPTRYQSTQMNWVDWEALVTPLSTLFIFAGLIAFLQIKTISSSYKILIASYTIVSFAFMFGNLYGLQFYYRRAIYFLAIPIGFGAVAFIYQWRNPLLRSFLAVCIVVSLGATVFSRTRFTRSVYQVITPNIMDGINWLSQHSDKTDVIVTTSFLGFQLPYLIKQPILVALGENAIGNTEEIPFAKDALDVLSGSTKTNLILKSRNIQYIVIGFWDRDQPNSAATLKILNANPRFERVFQNSDIVIYHVHPLTEDF